MTIVIEFTVSHIVYRTALFAVSSLVLVFFVPVQFIYFLFFPEFYFERRTIVRLHIEYGEPDSASAILYKATIQLI